MNGDTSNFLFRDELFENTSIGLFESSSNFPESNLESQIVQPLVRCIAAGLGAGPLPATGEQPIEKVYALDHYNIVPSGSSGLIGVSELSTRMIIACEGSYDIF